jgi:hypothetical protein
VYKFFLTHHHKLSLYGKIANSTSASWTKTGNADKKRHTLSKNVAIFNARLSCSCSVAINFLLAR